MAIICPQCDSTAASGAVFCSRCGQSFVGLRDTSEQPYRAPAPYYYPPPQPPPQPQYAMVPMQPMALSPWRCLRCGYVGSPFMVQKMSGAGVATLVILLIVFFPLFWIGFLIKETKCQCPQCRSVY